MIYLEGLLLLIAIFFTLEFIWATARGIRKSEPAASVLASLSWAIFYIVRNL